MPQPANAKQAVDAYLALLGRMKPMATDGPTMEELMEASYWVIELTNKESIPLYGLVQDGELRFNIVEDAALYYAQLDANARRARRQIEDDEAWPFLA